MEITWLTFPDKYVREKLEGMQNSIFILQRQVGNLIRKEDEIMADVQNLSDDLDQIKAGVLAAQAAIADLKAQVAAIQPGAATQEQLDALDAKTEEIKALLSPAPAEPPV